MSSTFSWFVGATPALMWRAFALWGSDVTWTELLACLLSVWMVVCNLRVQVMGWPLAILSSLLYAGLFVHYRLYGEASLQLVFVAVSAWGWAQWRHRPQALAANRPAVHRLSRTKRRQVGGLTLLAWPLLGWTLSRATDSDVPYLDALPTVGSIAGQLLLGRKCIENWPVWVLVNLVSMGLFAYKSLWLTVAVYGVFLVLALAGWRAWTERAREATHA